MSTALKTALLDATLLIQVFVAGLGAYTIHEHVLRGGTLYDIVPLAFLLLLFLVFVQIKNDSPTRKFTLVVEAVKSTIITIIWLFAIRIADPMSFWGSLLWGNVLIIVSLAIIFYSTLLVALFRRNGTGALHLSS